MKSACNKWSRRFHVCGALRAPHSHTHVEAGATSSHFAVDPPMSDDSVLLLEGKTERLLDDSERAPPADDYVVLPPLVYKIVFATLMITCFMAVRVV